MDELIYSEIKQRWQAHSKLPKYRVLYDLLREMVLSGLLVGGAVLPPSRSLAKQLKISRNTVNQSYEMLQSDGFLRSQQGSGVFVSEDVVDAQLISAEIEGEGEGDTPDISPRVREWVSVRRRHGRVVNAQPFSTGQPALDEFPFDIWARLLSRRWRLSGQALAVSEDASGYLLLRQHLAAYLQTSRGVKCSPEQIMIVSGAQQGLDLIARVLWSEGARVLVEDPAFPGMDGVIRGSGAELVSAPVDQDGILIEGFDNIKSYMVTPSRNYPLGVTMSLARRLNLLKEARRQQAWIVEDDFDSEFRFDGPPLSSLQGLDRDGRVIYVGTFSRIIFPALRLGYLVLPQKLVEPFRVAKSYIDGHASIVHQAALADFFEEGYFSSHIRRMKKLYQERRGYLIERLEAELSEFVKILPADGGLHLCVVFKVDIDDVAFAAQLEKDGVTLRPLSPFYRCVAPLRGMVMGFAGFDREKTDAALQIVKKNLSKLPEFTSIS
ncbi:Transcriptional regulator [Candidatus Terasakiella magnetica]|uniref:Transcriptional regulator n=1 Tax=Candidatus Terasakiella magnetica TaxID=1867952 RepID=A0A1C3RC39_9PROT|nr:PLP-dependent aminotransferase family protein [Candidatus Terasakiella magnetica]SCA54782.1 Transcriptional regulator [Candidatus Terasakiella magnetica]